MKKVRSHMSWTWILMVTFFILSILDIRFGILGFICMGTPLYLALRGKGKIHCAKYCPRGSFLGNFLKYVTIDNALPKKINTPKFRNGVLIFMLTVFGISLLNAGMNFNKIAMTMFRFMLVSSIVSILMGVFFKPRSWCQICPMGHATALIKKTQTNKNKS
ncbi:4Fe-4S binding protein [Defluviitalea phaphyphila]|uniref:4Fe-4S binding protein n=1 Tax=Defluviitalea phaphyphila TaxID=1473580 RepID=UPI000730C3A7|nr:4Fe-4S binding protein [Defluviitalea phaphyphila]